MDRMRNNFRVFVAGWHAFTGHRAQLGRRVSMLQAVMNMPTRGRLAF